MNENQEVQILLVEDSPTDARLMLRALSRTNIAARPLWVKDGSAALDYLFRQGEYAYWPSKVQPRLIILDLKLPQLSGIQILERIKSDDLTRAIPVVMMSSSCDEVDLRAAYLRNVNSYVVKPVEFEQLLRVMAEISAYWLAVNNPLP